MKVIIEANTDDLSTEEKQQIKLYLDILTKDFIKKGTISKITIIDDDEEKIVINPMFSG